LAGQIERGAVGRISHQGEKGEPMTPRHRAPGPDWPEEERPARPGRHGRGASRMRLIWVYPDLLSTYGDRGNLLVLERRARLRGIDTEALAVNADQPVPRTGDIYLMGGGEDLPPVLPA
jgi:lipid II isoglutaminyl synthase (glutamine-hydrolysing)